MRFIVAAILIFLFTSHIDAQLVPGTVPSWVPSSLPGSTGGLLYNSAGSLAAINSVASGSILASAGAGSAPAWTPTPSLTSLALGGCSIGSNAFCVTGASSLSSVVTPSLSNSSAMTINATAINLDLSSIPALTLSGTALGNLTVGNARATLEINNTVGLGSSTAIQVNLTNTTDYGLIAGFDGSGVSPGGYHQPNGGFLVNVQNGPLTFGTNNGNQMTLGATGGLVMGAATGTDKGTGTVNVATGYYVNGNSVLTGSALGSGVTGSSLTSLGTLTSLTVASAGVTINGSSSGSFALTANSTGAPLLSGVTSSTNALNYMCYNSSTGAMTYDSSGTCLVSSLRFKRDVKPLVGSLAFVEAVDPISFIYKDQSVISGIQEGVAAESMAAADPLSVEYDDEGRPLKPKIMSLIAHLYGAVQAQQREIAALRHCKSRSMALTRRISR